MTSTCPLYADNEFHHIVSNKETLTIAAEKLLDHIINDLTLGIIFDVHRKHKSKWYQNVEAKQFTSSVHDRNDKNDIFGHDTMKKVQNINCPICNRIISPTRFAKHIKECMGFGGRNASRRIVSNNINYGNNSKEEEQLSNSSHNTDEEEHDNWNARYRKKKKKKERSKTKKSKGGIKANVETDLVNVDIEGDDEGDIMLRDIIKDNSNQSSPADSVASSHSSVKKGEKSKGKRSKRDRSQ